MDHSEEYEMLLEAYEESGGNAKVFQKDDAVFLLVNGDKVLGANEVPGVTIESQGIPNGVRAKITVHKNVKLPKPAHLCFGIVGTEGIQNIQSEYVLEEGAAAKFLAHCTFPRAAKIVHIMDAHIHLQKGSSLTYEEVHYHGSNGGIEVRPVTHVVMDEGAYYGNAFRLVEGRVGKLDIDLNVKAGPRAVADLVAKVYGKADDVIKVKEKISLEGEHAKGIAKTRVFASEDAQSDVYTEVYGLAPNVRGHVDCVEVVKDRALVSAVPIIKVNNDTAELTHEASIGRVNKKQLDTLISRGLSEEEAINMIVKGMLR